MVSSCYAKKSDHNISTLQPESSTPTISADGKCLIAPEDLRQALEEDSLERLEIIIDGTRMLGGASTASLLGNDTAFLPASRHFTLDHFEPRPDGSCLARYSRSQEPGHAPE